ncbi:STAS domain-containing protein [Streptomyces sp. NPDC050095]|uniref:STAS domain-containing protein n=1 Tax=unclassified Streptomyces TaxID=2593676 RepID=UPI0034482C3D
MDRLILHLTTPDPAHHLELEISGELDAANTPKLCDAVTEALERGGRHLVLDLSGITWCDNASLYTLLGVRHAVHHVGGSLTICRASGAVCEALSRTGLTDLLPQAR